MSKTDELIEQFDKGEQPELDPDEAVVLNTGRGPEDRISSRVPKQLKRALELAAESGKNVEKSDLIRKALFDFLRDNNREALIQARDEIQAELELS